MLMNGQQLKLEAVASTTYLNGSSSSSTSGCSNSTSTQSNNGIDNKYQSQSTDLNNNNNSNCNNTLQHSPQLQTAQFYTTLLNASNSSSTQSATSTANASSANLIASINAANYANFMHLQQQQQHQVTGTNQLDLFNNMTTMGSLNSMLAAAAASTAPAGLNIATPPVAGGGHNISDELHLYDYMQKLLEEKEKLKELFNDPFNISLPISARLLDEGKILIGFIFGFWLLR